MSVFDNIQRAAYSVVTGLYGDDAVWQPSAGGDPVIGKVLFREPSKKGEMVQGKDYHNEYPTAEYFEPTTFGGLKKVVDDSKNIEYMTINGLVYGIKKVVRKYDGKTCTAHLTDGVPVMQP